MFIKTYAAKTSPGPVLHANEDGYDFDFENKLFMVLDGFGGSNVGDKAVSQIKDSIKGFLNKMSDDPNATMPLYYNPGQLLEGNVLINSLLSAHQDLFMENAQKKISQRAGVCGAFILIADEIALFTNVGNCQVYHYRQGNITQVISHHSFYSQSKDKLHFKFKTIPMTAFGLYQDLEFDIREIRLNEGDVILMMSDGVYPHFNHSELAHILAHPRYNHQEKVNNLLKLSNNRGNIDNQTALILEF